MPCWVNYGGGATNVSKAKQGYSPLNVDVPESLVNQLRTLAQEDGRKLNWLVQELLVAGLHGYRQRHPRFDRPVGNEPHELSGGEH